MNKEEKPKKLHLKKPNNKIELNPEYEETPSIYEKKSDTVVVGWGRMNPPTIGHEKLVNKILYIAKQQNGVPKIYLSHTKDKVKNPLSYEDKIKMAKEAFGKIIQKSNVKTIIFLMKELERKYENVVVVVGSDRISEFNLLLNKYNGKEYSFQSIRVLSAGERDPDEDGVAGMSASKMRQAAASNNFEVFKFGLPTKLKSKAKFYFDLIRKEMGISEEISRSSRLKKARTLKKYQPKVQRRRAQQMKKRADQKRIRKRSRILARDIVRKKLLRGRNWSDISAAEKSRIESMLNQRKKMISRLTTRVKKDVKRKETERLRNPKNVNEEIMQICDQIFPFE